MNPKARSPYRRRDKVPFTYTHGRCQHNHTHVETFSVGERKDRVGVQVKVCDACNTVRSDPKFTRRVQREAA